MFPRPRGVTFMEFHFQEGEILKICSVINHHNFSGWSPQPEIWRKMRFSVLGLWLRHCDSGNLLPDSCCWRHRSRVWGICVEKESKGWLNNRLWTWGPGGVVQEVEGEWWRSEEKCQKSRWASGDAVTEPFALRLHKRLCKNQAVLRFFYKKIHHFTPTRNRASFSPFQQPEGSNISDQTMEVSSEEQTQAST